MSDELPTTPKADNLRYYQLAALGALGLYLYKAAQSQNKSIFGGEEVVIGKFKMQLNPEKMVDSAAPWIELEPAKKQMVVTALKEFLKGLKNK